MVVRPAGPGCSLSLGDVQCSCSSFFVVPIVFSVAWCVVESRSVPSSFPASVVNARMQVRNFIVRWMVWGFQSDVTSSVLVFSAGVHSELDSGRGVSVIYEYSRPGHLLVAHGRAEWEQKEHNYNNGINMG